MKGMLKENSLKDKVILVTGGGSGLGKSMVEYFLELGANVIITSRREELLNDVAKEFNSKYKSEVFPIACDVRKIEQVEKVILRENIILLLELWNGERLEISGSS